MVPELVALVLLALLLSSRPEMSPGRLAERGRLAALPLDAALVALLVQLDELAVRYTGRHVQVVSGRRTRAYDLARGHRIAHSQHWDGRAADLVVGGVDPGRVHAAILAAWTAGQLPALGGLGAYASHTHVDVRPHNPGELTRWRG